MQSTKSRSYIVYEYGCRPPVQGGEAAVDQMYRRNRLWNALVEVERDHRSAWLETVHDQDGRRCTPLSADQKLALDRIEITRRAAVKQAQAESGLYWCNYDDVITSYERARKGVIKVGGDLRFHAWDGAGKVTVRFQYGLPVSSVYGEDTRLQIAPVDGSAWTSPERSVRRRLARTTARIRIGTNKRAPIWLELPIILHRPMPGSGVIRAASVIRECIGRRDRWRLLVTVEQSVCEPGSGSPVGIDLGWRLVPSGLRVAYWEDERGDHGELVLDQDVLWEFSKLKEIQAAQKRHFNQVQQALKAWSTDRVLPPWMDLTKIDQWSAPRRLLRLYAAWKDQRFEGDSRPFSMLEQWHRRYFRRSAWADNLRDQVLHHRREIYRRFVADLFRSHSIVFIEDLDLRALSRKATPESHVPNFGAPMRVVAAPSLLRKLLEEKGACRCVNPAFSTQRCSWCGYCGPWDGAANLDHECESCGRLFDQDRNAARNILRHGMTLEVAGVTRTAVLPLV